MDVVVFHDIGEIRDVDVPEPAIKHQQEGIVRSTASATCGTDLHLVRGMSSSMAKGSVLGHEGIGVVEAIKDADYVLVTGFGSVGADADCVGQAEGWTGDGDSVHPNLVGTEAIGSAEQGHEISEWLRLSL